jgi:ADP-dependent NAD(P)H-hydrate dehydratase / NAD(P)H-hydrate epimerase
VIPVVTPDEMAAIDAGAPEPVEVLIERAGAAVARHALEMLGGAYGRRVVVLAGKGNNGNDGRAAASRLRRRGVTVVEVDAADAPEVLPRADLLVDAAYGTGLRGRYDPPVVPQGTRVLAVDIASGVDGSTGEIRGSAIAAERTVSFAAFKPGQLLEPGRSSCGALHLCDIGLDVSRAGIHVVEALDVAGWVPPRRKDAHKWQHAVWVIAGSPGMTGAAHLAAGAAMRAGSGYVRLSVPGADQASGAPIEVVHVPVAADLAVPAADVARFGAVVVGPGLGRAEGTAEAVRRLVASLDAPVIIDGDGLTALGAEAVQVVRARSRATVITPHDGEFAALVAPPGPDRIAAVRALARRMNAVVLLKGPTTVVAAPSGRVLVSLAGDERLATAGTGDVLAGVIGAFVARGTPPFEAAAAGAFVHGCAAELGPRVGLVAGDLPKLVARALGSIGAG